MDIRRLKSHEYNTIIVGIALIVEKPRMISIHRGRRWSQTLRVWRVKGVDILLNRDLHTFA